MTQGAEGERLKRCRDGARSGYLGGDSREEILEKLNSERGFEDY